MLESFHRKSNTKPKYHHILEDRHHKPTLVILLIRTVFFLNNLFMKLYVYTTSTLVVMDFLRGLDVTWVTKRFDVTWVTQRFDLWLCFLPHLIASIVTDFLYHSSKEPASLGMMNFFNDHLTSFWNSEILCVLTFWYRSFTFKF